MDRHARQTEHQNGRTMLRKSIPNDATFLMKLYFRFIRLRFGMRHSILIRSLPGRKATKETLTMSFTYLLTYVCIVLHYQDQTTRHRIIVIKKITSHHMLFDSITYVDVVSKISKIIKKMLADSKFDLTCRNLKKVGVLFSLGFHNEPS